MASGIEYGLEINTTDGQLTGLADLRSARLTDSKTFTPGIGNSGSEAGINFNPNTGGIQVTTFDGHPPPFFSFSNYNAITNECTVNYSGTTATGVAVGINSSGNFLVNFLATNDDRVVGNYGFAAFNGNDVLVIDDSFPVLAYSSSQSATSNGVATIGSDYRDTVEVTEVPFNEFTLPNTWTDSQLFFPLSVGGGIGGAFGNTYARTGTDGTNAAYIVTKSVDQLTAASTDVGLLVKDSSSNVTYDSSKQVAIITSVTVTCPARIANTNVLESTNPTLNGASVIIPSSTTHVSLPPELIYTYPNGTSTAAPSPAWNGRIDLAQYHLQRTSSTSVRFELKGGGVAPSGFMNVSQPAQDIYILCADFSNV